MLALLGRTVPVQVSRSVALAVLVLVALVSLGAAFYAIGEMLFGRGADLTLRATGHPRPRKSAARTAIDQLEQRISRRS